MIFVTVLLFIGLSVGAYNLTGSALVGWIVFGVLVLIAGSLMSDHHNY